MAEQVLLPIRCERVSIKPEESQEKIIMGYATIYQANPPLKKFFNYVIAVNWYDGREKFAKYKTFKNHSFEEANSELEKLASRDQPLRVSWDKKEQMRTLVA